MSTLILVRHGQATLHGDDYDVLSPLGEKQSRALGTKLASWKTPIDAVYSGPLTRHLDTLRHMRAAASEGGLELPETCILEGFREMEVAALVSEAMRRVLPSCPDLRTQLETGTLTEQGQEAMRHVGGVLGKLLERWARGELPVAGLEPYEPFASRVRTALHTVMKTERRGRRVLIVTSGGPITVALRLALGLDAPRSIELLSSIANASLTELRYTEDAITLESFNRHSHTLEGGLYSRI
ncbi:MAG: histidine phosphatase family protein [Myxococcales bacterium]|nr:histidine phosphatase family protein [Myxococcales bacterium]